ncbi:hypothetical protein D6D12_06697 [Aureobasidium pullulans]|uniref:C3H1-type domain-containing protein n=1 Tax=Aureobasidium pullulans TaxID=5580 RepID=A0AB74JNU6_AURPU|nr:hypothetical protein D6D12_06697 [Aureobasidium pullulans]THX64934.1 hypothetical protein D6D11_00819 [Aureobasidium pullulans]
MATSNPCFKFAAYNSCRLGARCPDEHHENLDPALVGNKDPKGYMVPNVAGEACLSCLQNGRECDKRTRYGDDNPCSECRWFGGENRICSLSKDTSYNDQLWALMMGNGINGYILPQPKPRDQAKKIKNKGGPPTLLLVVPMPNSRVRPDWIGLSRDELLAKPDMLPPGVRECPRAFLVAPRLSNTHQKGSKRVAEFGRHEPAGQNKSFAYASSSTPLVRPAHLLPPRPPPSFEQLPPDPIMGRVVHTFSDFEAGRMPFEYENTARMTVPLSTAHHLARLASAYNHTYSLSPVVSAYNLSHVSRPVSSAAQQRPDALRMAPPTLPVRIQRQPLPDQDSAFRAYAALCLPMHHSEASAPAASNSDQDTASGHEQSYGTQPATDNNELYDQVTRLIRQHKDDTKTADHDSDDDK